MISDEKDPVGSPKRRSKRVTLKTLAEHVSLSPATISVLSGSFILGLGDAKNVDCLSILWPDGTSTTHKNINADQILVIEQPAPGE